MEQNACSPILSEDVHTILIVDDDEFNRAILNNLFSEIYAIREAENGRAGLEEILKNRDHICAVLLDVMMPEMSGIEVLQRLKEENLLERIPVFLITAETDATMKTAYELGAMDVIGKPIVPYLVLRRVNSVVELFQARRRLENRVVEQDNELLEKTQKILTLNQGMIETLSTAIEFRNSESGGHVTRIHDITAILLSETNFCPDLSEEEVENIALASVMHDVGKIAIPDHILNKPGRLTPEEFEIHQDAHHPRRPAFRAHTPAAGKQFLPIRLGHCPPPPRTMGWQRISRWAQGGRDQPLGAGSLHCGRVRCLELQAGLQRRLPQRAGGGDDPQRSMRHF